MFTLMMLYCLSGVPDACLVASVTMLGTMEECQQAAPHLAFPFIRDHPGFVPVIGRCSTPDELDV